MCSVVLQLLVCALTVL